MKKYTILVFFIFFSLIMTLTVKASVRSYSQTQTIYIDGKEYERIVVNCRQYSNSSTIIREVGTSEWCSGEIKSYCFSTSLKLKAAQEVCRSNYNDLIKQQNKDLDKPDEASSVQPEADPEPSIIEPEVAQLSPQEREALEQELLQIEEEQITLDQKKLEIRKRELDLKKRELRGQN